MVLWKRVRGGSRGEGGQDVRVMDGIQCKKGCDIGGRTTSP